MKYLCKIYEDRPDFCRDYPWGESYDESDYHEGCQFYDIETKKLISKEDLLKEKTAEEIENSCCSCGMCCNFWDRGKPLFPCSALQVVDDKGRVIYETELTPKSEAEDGSSTQTGSDN